MSTAKSVVFLGSLCFLPPSDGVLSGNDVTTVVSFRPKRSQQFCDFAQIGEGGADAPFTIAEAYHHTFLSTSGHHRTAQFAPIVILADPTAAVPEDVDPHYIPRTASAALEVARQELHDASNANTSAVVAPQSVDPAAQAPPPHTFTLPLHVSVTCDVTSGDRRLSYSGSVVAPDVDALVSSDLMLALVQQGNDTATVHCCLRLLDLSFAVLPTLTAPWSDPNGASVGTPVSPALSQHVRRLNSSGARVPYGIMPLYTLYDHAVFYTRVLCGPDSRHCRAIPSLRRVFGQAAALKGPLCAVVPHPTLVAHRWELLKELDCSSIILGDVGFSPLAVTLTCCRGLRRLNLKQNNLSLPSAKRVVAAVRSGLSGVQELYLSNNQFFELGGEELLRLLKGDPGALALLDVSNNGFSGRLLSRFETLSKGVHSQLLEDPLNAMSARFDYLVHMDALPSQCWQQVEPLWRMLTVTPPLPPGLTGSPSAGVPVAAAAPLLSEIIRSVFMEMAKERQDAAIRIVFGPIGAYTQEITQGTADSVFSPASVTAMTADAMYLQSYVKMLVTTLRVALDAPVHWEDAVQALRSIGAQHERNGIDAALYCTANRHLLRALEAHVPEETLTPHVKAAVIQVLALMTRSTVSGMPQCV